MGRRCKKSGYLFLVVIAGFLPGACTSDAPINHRPATVPDPYSGPALRLESTGPFHVAVATVPSGGWQFSLDGTWEDLNQRSAYVSLIRPNPSFLYPQRQVEIRLTTEIEVATGIELLARVVPFGGLDSKTPYSRAATAAAVDSTP